MKLKNLRANFPLSLSRRGGSLFLWKKGRDTETNTSSIFPVDLYHLCFLKSALTKLLFFPCFLITLLFHTNSQHLSMAPSPLAFRFQIRFQISFCKTVDKQCKITGLYNLINPNTPRWVGAKRHLPPLPVPHHHHHHHYNHLLYFPLQLFTSSSKFHKT